MSKSTTAATTSTNHIVAASKASSSSSPAAAAAAADDVLVTPSKKVSLSASTARNLRLDQADGQEAGGQSVLMTSPSSPLDAASASGQASNAQYYAANGGGSAGSTSAKDKKKIGHREVKDGIVHYKKVSTDELKKSIQFGIVHFINEQNRANSKYNIDRDLLMQDFQTVETIVFPRAGSTSTPAHSFNDFKLKVYAPYGFKYLRRKFNVNEVDFMHALGETDLKEISNPGASGSVFYKTSNDKYILKTVQNKESEFLMTLLAGYALNLLQNLINGKYTLLPTIYGLFCYQKLELASLFSDKTNIRIVIMNNILPSDLPIHEKYDLKGSLYKRKASTQERSKSSPTYKDLDFLEVHPDGIILDERHYENIISSLKRDCLILQSFSIMDYSMLLGIHNLEKEKNNNAIEAYYEAKIIDPPPQTTVEAANSQTSPIILTQTKSSHRNLENVFNISAVPARSARGERLLLYFGIIDILQNYRLKKRAEHTLKSMITDGRTISVCPPNFYANRFIEFMTTKVFKKATLKSSPARKRTLTFRVDSNLKKNDDVTTPSQAGPSSTARFSRVSTTSTASQQQAESDRETDSAPPPPVPPSSRIPISNSSATSVFNDAVAADQRAQQQRQQPVQHQQSTTSDYKQSFKNIRAIDSVDSVSAILADSSKPAYQNTTSTNRYGDYKPSSMTSNHYVSSTSASRLKQQQQSYQSSFNSGNMSKFNAIEDSENSELNLKIDSYKSDNEIENKRTSVTPIIHHYKTLDNKINYIKTNLDMNHQEAKSLANSKRDLTNGGDSSSAGLSTNGITLKIQTPSSSYYNTYSNKSLSSSNNRHDSSVLLSNNENDPNSLCSSPWNQSPSLKHYDSNFLNQNQSSVNNVPTQPHKFNGEKSSSHQFITKIHINGSGHGNGKRDKSFMSQQEARISRDEYRAASPASLQYSLTPIARLGANNASTSVQYNEVEFVPLQFSVKRNLYKTNLDSNRLQPPVSSSTMRSQSIKENRVSQLVVPTASSLSLAHNTAQNGRRHRIANSFSVKTNNSSVVTVLDRDLTNNDEYFFNEDSDRDDDGFRLSNGRLAPPPKYMQKQILQKNYSFYVVDTLVPTNDRIVSPLSAGTAHSPPNRQHHQQQHYHVQYSVSSNIKYFDQSMGHRYQQI